jgi:hypothetical protein
MAILCVLRGSLVNGYLFGLAGSDGFFLISVQRFSVPRLTVKKPAVSM